METRIRTTMIGAIDIFQKKFEKELENPDFKEKFTVARKEILDLGNNQIRLFKKEQGK